jgi:hypothetical protein
MAGRSGRTPKQAIFKMRPEVEEFHIKGRAEVRRVF